MLTQYAISLPRQERTDKYVVDVSLSEVMQYMKLNLVQNVQVVGMNLIIDLPFVRLVTTGFTERELQIIKLVLRQRELSLSESAEQ